MAPALTEAAGQTQKLQLKLPFAPPTAIPSHRLIAPTRTYLRNNNNNNNNNNKKKDLVLLDENVVDAVTLEKLLQACPVADIEFEVDGKRRGNGDEVSAKAREKTSTENVNVGSGYGASSEIAGSTCVSSTPTSLSYATCKPTMNGGRSYDDVYVITGVKEQCPVRAADPIGKDVRNSLINASQTKRIDANNKINSSACVTQALSTTLSASDELARASRVLTEKTMARERFQENLERRARRLVRRICRLRVSQASQHVSRQLLEFVAFQKGGEASQSTSNLHAPSTSTAASVSKQKHPLLDALLMRTPGDLSRVPKHDLDVGSLLRRLESSHNEKVRATRLSASRFSISGVAAEMMQPPTSIGDKLDANMCEDMEWTCGSLFTDINYLDREVDSDATASSSGGESYDELEDYDDDPRPKSTTLRKRAFWKWAVDRASIVSRWTWLQAQVSDLEYRIRQTSEIHRQIRRLKDGPTSATTSSSSSTFSARDKSSSQVNGFLSKNGGIGLSSGECDSCSRTRCPAKPAVKRLLVRTTAANSNLSGRQLLATRRASRPLTLRCSCVARSRSSLPSTSAFPPHTCVLCATRASSDITQSDCIMSRNERIALLDPSFHSVLSLPRDTSLTIHFEALLKSGEHGKQYSKAKAVAVKKKPRTLQINEHARKQCRKLKKNATVTLTARLRKMSKGRPVSVHKQSESSDGHRHLRQRPKRPYSKKPRNESESSACSSKNGTPVPSPELGDNSSSQASGNSGWGLAMSESRRGSGASVGLLEMLRRKRGESEYDIDNIVIPYSMAASTRVERLQYKEILTPKWRFVPECDVYPRPPSIEGTRRGIKRDGNLEMQDDYRLVNRFEENMDGIAANDDDHTEDVSDEAVILRHEKCELTEKKRFLGFMKNAKPGGGNVVAGTVKGAPAANVPVGAGSGASVITMPARRTRSMRSDSHADSSGANTPDPLSPPPPSIVVDHDMTISLPPPLTAYNNNNQYHHHQNIQDIDDMKQHQPPSLVHERRRTTSLSRRDRMIDDVRVPTPTTDLTSLSEPRLPVAPWEPRTFPLRDAVYEEMIQESKVVHAISESVHFTRLAAATIPESEWNGSADVQDVSEHQHGTSNSIKCAPSEYADSSNSVT